MKKETFNKLTKAKQRVVIAKDVLLRINKKKIKPQTGRFCVLPSGLASGEPLQNFMNKKRGSCYTCAKGGLFMSFVGINNKFNVGDYLSENIDSESMKELSKTFTKKQLALIETAFEKAYYYWNVPLTNSEKQKAIDFCNGSAKNRLVKICKNIIKNKGAFKP